jgi:hypothetical protein
MSNLTPEDNWNGITMPELEDCVHCGRGNAHCVEGEGGFVFVCNHCGVCGGDSVKKGSWKGSMVASKVRAALRWNGLQAKLKREQLIDCPHPDKVYSGEYFASDPPQYHWICPTCGEVDADPLIHPPTSNLKRFRRLLKLGGHEG